MLDTKALAGAMADVVREHLEPLKSANDALQRRLDSLEARTPEKGEDGADGRDGVDGKDGVSIDVATVERMVADAISALPAPKDGRDGADGTDGADGQAIEMDDVQRMVSQAVAALPPPTNGRDGADGRDGANGRDGVGERGVDGIDGRDGVGVAGALIDRDGVLNLTLTNGDVKALGRVEGRDGADGERGEAGFSLDDFDVSLKDDGRTLELSFVHGDTAFVRELALPTMIYRGAYADGQNYEKGDTVTWAGSLWHCNGGESQGEWTGATTEKPGDGSKSWTLAAKRGRDGKDFAGPQNAFSTKVKI